MIPAILIILGLIISAAGVGLALNTGTLFWWGLLAAGIILLAVGLIRASSSMLRLLLIIVLLITLVFIPTGVALLRRHRRLIPIFLINLFLGATVIAWIVVLVWSFSGNTARSNK